MNENKLDKYQMKLLLTRADLKTLGVWLSNSQLLRLESDGRFPRRVRLSASSVCWAKDEVLEWLKARKEERKNWYYSDAN